MNVSNQDKNQNNINNFSIKNIKTKNSISLLNDIKPESEKLSKTQYKKIKIIDLNDSLYTNNKTSNIVIDNINNEKISSKRELEKNNYKNSIQITKNPNQEKMSEIPINSNNHKSHRILKTNTIENTDGENLIQYIGNKHSIKSYMTDKSENTSSINIVRCLFCDILFEINPDDKQLYDNCNHYFCKKCGKIYYEDLIQNYINSYNKNNNISLILKCPIFDCQNKISEDLLQNIISKKYYTDLNNLLTLNNNGTNNENKLVALKKNNVLDINNDKEKYLLFVKKLYLKCPSCEEFSLFSKIDGHFLKCLKCQKKYCKYCRKLCNSSHFDISYKNYCKVFYRANKKRKIQNFCIKYLMNLIYVVFGYIFFFTFCILMMKKVIKSKKKLFNKILWCFVYLVGFILFGGVCIIFLPYFPIINCL